MCVIPTRNNVTSYCPFEQFLQFLVIDLTVDEFKTVMKV